MITLWNSGCPPILGFSPGGEHAEDCMRFMERSARRIEASRSIRKVVVAARWARYLEWGQFDNGEGGIEAPTRLDRPPLDRADAARFQAALMALVSRLKQAGKQVVIAGPVPEVGWNVPAYLRAAALFGRADPPTTGYARFRQRQYRTFIVLKEVAERTDAEVIYPDRVLCRPSSGRCVTTDGRSPYYSDDDHLSPLGAQAVVKRYAQQLLE